MFKTDVLSIEAGGRCFVIGELNGNFAALGYFVNAVDLDPRSDMVILNGNFLGMAPSSREVLAWLSKSWVRGVSGLNEIGVLNRLREGASPSLMGQWLAFLSVAMKKELEAAIMALPIAIELNHDERSVVVSNKPLAPEHWENTKKAIYSWGSAPEDIFSLFEDRLAAISIVKKAGYTCEERADRCLSVSSLAMEAPSLPVTSRNQVILTGSAHMNHGSIYQGPCLLPYVELLSLLKIEESERWLGHLVIEQKSFQMKNSFLRAL